MSIFPRSLPHFSPSKFALLVLALIQVDSLSPLQAMEQATSDLVYCNALRQAFKSHNFNPDHFIEQEDSIPLYDIKQASLDRIHQMHQENMKNFQTYQGNLEILKQSALLSASMTDNPSSSYWDLLYYPRCLWEIVGNNIPSLSWPSFSFFSTPSSSPNLNTLESENPLDNFHLIESTSTTIANLSVSNIDTTPQDWSTKSTQFTLSNSEYLGLSLDGGGVRGLMLALWIAYLEEKTKQPVSKIFDLIGGTSIGGILASLVTASDDGKTPRMHGHQLPSLIEHSERIFPQHSKYNLPAKLWDEIESLFYTRYPAQPLEDLLKEHLGELTLNNCLTRTLITAVNAETVTPRIFDSFNPIDKVCKVWEVARCTSAASTTLPAYLLDGVYYIDGGFAKNNPGLDVLKGLSEMPSFSFDKTTILSLGTGNMPLGKIPANAGLTSVGTIVDALFITQSKSVEMTLAQLLPNGYSRANPTFDVPISLDQLDANSIRLLKEGAESQYGIIETFAESDIVQTKLERISKTQ